MVQIKISGVEYRATDNYNISQQAGSASSSSVVVMCDDDYPIPKVKESVEILVDSVPVFFGLITNVNSPSLAYSYDGVPYQLSVNSAEEFLNNHYPSEAYEDKSTHEIIQDLFTNYIEPDGISLGSISTTTKQYENFNFSLTQLSQIVTELADDVNATWYISPDKKFYFLVQNDFEECADLPDIANITKSSDAVELRTRQIITGAKERTAEQVESVIWVEDQTTFTTGYPVYAITSITINDVAAGVGVLGLDDEDTTKTFLYTYNSDRVSVNNNATVKPAVTDEVEITYFGIFDIIIDKINDSKQQELAALNGSSGIIENVYTDETIDNQSDAENKAAALLDLYSEEETEIKLDCHDMDKSQLLKQWEFDYPEKNIVGKYVITSREITSFGANALRCTITLNSKNFMRRNGKTLNPKKKNVGRDIKIYKSSDFGDTVNATDSVVFGNTTLTCYPVVAGDTRIYNSGLEGFYPI